MNTTWSFSIRDAENGITVGFLLHCEDRYTYSGGNLPVVMSLWMQMVAISRNRNEHRDRLRKSCSESQCPRICIHVSNGSTGIYKEERF